MGQKKNLFEKIRKKSLKYSIKDGSAYAVMDSVGNGYISPYAIAIGANNSYIGFLASVPGLITSLFQLKTPKMMEKHSRKSIVTTFALFQALMWFPLVVISLINMRSKYALFLLLVFYVILVSFNAAIGPAWASWMKDLVKEKESGKFFGRRNLITGFIGLIALLATGFILDWFKKANSVFIGFAILFGIAMIARLASRHFLTKKYEPKLRLDGDYYFTFWQFIKRMCYNNFGRFVIYIALFQFAVNIASPFFTVYMLKDLKFSYLLFTILTTAQSLAMLISMPLWGRFADKHGNRCTLKIAGIIIPFVPLLWLFSSNLYYLIAVQILSGLFWAAFNLSASNFIYDSVSRERMGLCVAYSNVLNTVGVFIGATLGGLLSTHIRTGINPFFALLILSTLFRFIVSFVMLPKIKEVREIKEFKIERYAKAIRFK